MAKVFTPEEREEVKARIVEFVRLSGRETFRQLADKTGVSKTAIRRLSGALATSGDVWPLVAGYFHQSRRIAYGVRHRRRLLTRH